MAVNAPAPVPVGDIPPVAQDRTYWRLAVAPYERASIRSATLGVLTSAVAYVAMIVAMYLLLDVSVWLTLALAIPTSGFLLRTFIVFHDCTHGSYLPSRRGNRWLGRLTGLVVYQPYANWGHNHAVHHGTAGDLDRRGQGDVETLPSPSTRRAPGGAGSPTASSAAPSCCSGSARSGR